ncbi:MAG: cation:proton antiporter [Candidatus Borkfalkiaceae bacterium]|nr:cation:proton antiporter [Clostridia bacterium]MDY6222608.1 cation:proton antiporter [Christensenellaceae bacterium]
MEGLYEKLQATSPVSAVILAIAVILAAGFLMTRLTKPLRLPNVTAYIVAGILIGPFCLKAVPQNVIKDSAFVSDIALAFIAFSAGEFFRVSSFRGKEKQLLVITLFEALIASLFVFVLTFFVLKLGLAFSLVLAALASATAPASTLMTIRQTGAKGDFVDTLISVVALDDVVSLFAFSVAISVAMASVSGVVESKTVLLPFAYNLLMIALGGAMGYLLKLLMTKRSTDNRLIVSIALLFALCGVGAALGVSPLLACMVMGAVYINASNDDKLFKQLNYFSPPVLLFFFVRSGMSFRLDTLFDASARIAGVPLLVIGVLYFAVRIIGKYTGAYIGCKISRKPKKTTNTLGLALIPQAGVAIGLSELAARTIGGETGEVIQTIIMSSSILYELIGPAMAKLALVLSGAIGGKDAVTEEKVPQKTERELLIERMNAIQAEIDKDNYARSEEEKAFSEAAEEYGKLLYGNDRNRKFINRR